ncbi:hypothetical protein R3P38DRAFT_2413198, partial [Favolaschia claudopus]
NVFLQNIHLPISSTTPLPQQIKTMITTAQKYELSFNALTISREVKLKMPIWRHPGVRKEDYDNACRRRACECLRSNHGVRTVEDVLVIATRRTLDLGKPHTANPSGISRQNCVCVLCRRDREELRCKNPGKCINVANLLIGCLHPKWRP